MLHAISCASTSDCIVTGYEKTANTGVILATTNGGVTWKSQTSGTSEKLWGVSCPAVSTCFILGNAGTILHTTDGGAVWTAQASGASDPLYGVSCPTTSVCVVVGERSTVLHTSNGGSTWVPQTSPVTTNLFGVSCHDALHCVIVGLRTAGNVPTAPRVSPARRLLARSRQRVCLPLRCRQVARPAPRVGHHRDGALLGLRRPPTTSSSAAVSRRATAGEAGSARGC